MEICGFAWPDFLGFFQKRIIFQYIYVIAWTHTENLLAESGCILLYVSRNPKDPVKILKMK